MLIVGCKNEEKFEQFTEAQRQFIPSFGGMGLMCVTTGVGHIHKKGEEITYGVSIQEAYRRFALYDRIFSTNYEEGEGFWPITLEFVEQLAEADFSCNVSTKSNEECDHTLAWWALGKLNDTLRLETGDRVNFSLNSITRDSYHKTQELKRTAKNVINTWLGRHEYGDEYMDECVAELIDNMGLYDQYHWDEDNNNYSLKKEEE